ncbi:MAG: hypothetical protein V1859_08475 [archaeon]
MKMKHFAIILMVLVAAVGSALACVNCDGESASSANIPVINCEVELNGDWINEDVTNRLSMEVGEDMEVKVRLSATADAEDVQIDAFISGYEYSDYQPIQDSISAFNMKANTTYIKKLKLTLPDNMEGDKYKLRIIISDRDSASKTYVYNLVVELPRHNVVLKDIILDPSKEVVSGRALLASVRVKNMGDKDEEGIKVTVSIPALDIEASEYIDELESDESTTSEDLYLRIPKCVPEGTYVVKATLKYDENYEINSKETSIKITKDETCDAVKEDDKTPSATEKTVITVPGKQDVMQGASGTVYPIMISNTGANSKSYKLTVTGVDSWGTYRIDPSNLVVVGAKKTETVYVYVSAGANAAPGEKLFMVTVEADGETKQIPLTANVVESTQNNPTVTGDWDKIKKGLEVGLVVLVVLLVILGLVVGFNKLKGNEDGKEPEEVSGQTYY